MNEIKHRKPGAGRKTGKTHTKVLISLPLNVAEWLETQENRSRYISKLVENKMLKDKGYYNLGSSEYSKALCMLLEVGNGGHHIFDSDNNVWYYSAAANEEIYQHMIAIAEK